MKISSLIVSNNKSLLNSIEPGTFNLINNCNIASKVSVGCKHSNKPVTVIFTRLC